MTKAKQGEIKIIFYFKSKSKRNQVAKVVTKPEFLVAKEKMLVAILATILPSVACKCEHVRKKHVVIGGKHDMFCH